MGVKNLLSIKCPYFLIFKNFEINNGPLATVYSLYRGLSDCLERLSSMFYFCLGSRACSECSCENCDCDHHLEDEGPNQVNFLATTTDLTADRSLSLPLKDTTSESLNKTISPAAGEENNDLQQQLHRVLGALESNIELRKQHKPNDVDMPPDPSEADLESSFLEEARNVRFVHYLVRKNCGGV